MKKISIISACILLAVACVIGCKKNIINYGSVELQDDTKALLKFNYASQYANNRSVYLKINDQRVSNLITGRTPFPGGGYNTGGSSTTDFLQVTPGTIKISVGLPRKVDNGTDSIILYSTTIDIAAAKNYVVHITDTAATTKTVLTEEVFTKPDSLVSRFHFINLMPNVPAIDLYYGATAANATDQSTDSLLVSNIAYLQNSADFTIKMSGANKIFKIRPAGAAKTAATLLATYTTTSVPNSRRSFTAFASGYSGKVSPSTQRPYISIFLIR
jgi:hypothetical protein